MNQLGWRGFTRALGVLAALFAAEPDALAQAVDGEENADTTTSPRDADDAPWNRGVSRGQQERARALLLEGNRLIKVPLFIQAAAKYQEAIEIWPHPAFYYNLAVAQLNLVQPIEAYKNFEQALRHGPEPLGEEKYQQARSHLEILEKRLARLTITCEVTGAEVSLDGEHLFTGPGVYEVVTSPGQHQLVAAKVEHVPDTKQVSLTPGVKVGYTMLPIPVSEVTRKERYWSAWKPWAALATGAGLLAGAGYLDWQSARGISMFDEDFAARCSVGGCDKDEIPEMVARLESAERQQDVAIGLYIAGGLSVAVGASLVYINRERLVERAASDGSRALSLVPEVTPGSAILSARLRY